MRSLVPALLLCGLHVHAQQWVQLPDFPGTARDDAASFTWNDKVFVGTGLDAGFQLTNDWYAFDVGTMSWDTIAPLPTSGRQYASGFSLNGRGSLFGGLDASGPLNELWSYDPTTDTWDQRASLPAPGRYACAAMTTSQYAYICTGMMADGVPTNEVWRYDPATDTWAARAAAPGPVRHRSTAQWNVLMGGADVEYEALAEVLGYDEGADSWTIREDMPDGRYAADIVDNIHIGGVGSDGAIQSAAWRYSWADDTWNTTELPPFAGGPRRGGVIAPNTYLLDVGIIYYGTGSDNVQRHKDWWMLNYGVGIAEHRTQGLSVHPNPVRDRVSIGYPEGSGPVRLSLVDMSGRVLGNWSDRPASIDLSAIATGHYLLRLDTEGTSTITKLLKLP